MARREYGGSTTDFTTDKAGLIRAGKDAYFWAARTGGSLLTDIQAVAGAGTVTAGKYVSAAAGAIGILGPEGYDADGIWVSASPDPASARLWLRALVINGTGTGSGGGGGGVVGDATATAKGVVQLAGHLGGTAASPTVTRVYTKSDVGLGSVDNTSDVAKPVSTATATALAAKADLVGGLIPTAQLPALAIKDTVVVASQAAMLALTSTQVQKGDVAVRTDGAGTFILTAADPSQLANWTRLNAPTDVVQSVNGQVGTVVLGAADVGASPTGAYVKPGSGIPAADLAPDVPTKAAVDANTTATQNNTTAIATKLSTADAAATYEQKGSALPLIAIDVDGGTAITSKDVYSAATIRITGGGYPAFTATTQIRGRGNYTWTLPKKPYRLKLTTAASILGLPTERDFALLANHTDATMLNTALAMSIGAASPGLAWTPKSVFVELVLNGEYQGVYQLIENVEISSTAPRVPGPAAKGTTGDAMTGTYLLEIDPQYGATEPGITTGKAVRVLFDDPDGSTPEHATFITSKVQDFENALYGANFKDATAGYLPHIDRDAFIDWYLIEELGSNQDSPFNSSCKLYRTADAAGVPGKLTMGPLWDFDIAFGNVVNTAHPANGLFTRPGAKWLQRMFADPTFVAALNTRWAAMVARLTDPVTGYAATLDRLDKQVSSARTQNHSRWALSYRWDSNTAAKKAWIARRIAWLTAEFTASADGSRGDTAAGVAPWIINAVAPAITGTATTGQVLTTSTGRWSATPDSYTYSWKRSGVTISGATLSTYTLVSADENQQISCTVTAVKAGHTSGAAGTASVTAAGSGNPALSNTTAPAITGTPSAGQTLTVSNGTWSATPDSYTYAWKRAGAAISGATASTYVLVSADVGQAITCDVTAIKAGYTSATATSNTVTPGSGVVGDDFNRANSATGLGTSSSGTAWTAVRGTWGIIDNQAYDAGNAEGIVTLAAGGADHYAQAKIVSSTGNPMMVIRCASDGNGLYGLLFTDSSKKMEIYRRVGGNFTYMFNVGDFALGDTVRFAAKGSNLTVLRNGTQVASVTDTNVNGGSPGLRADTNGARFDDFVAALT